MAGAKLCEVCGQNPAEYKLDVLPAINGRAVFDVCRACLRKLTRLRPDLICESNN